MAKRRTRPLGSIRLEPGGWYSARLPKKISPERKTLSRRFVSRADAENAILREVLEYENGVKVLNDRGLSSSLTVGELIEKYIKTRFNDPIVPISINTRKQYVSAYRTHIENTPFSKILVKELSTRDIKMFLAQKPTNRNKPKFLISMVVGWANENDYFPNPVFFPTETKRHGKNTYRNERGFEVRLPMFSEVANIACSETLLYRWRLVILLGFFTGCRLNEILSLTRDNINRERGTISIQKVFAYHEGTWISELPKNGLTREQYVPKRLFSYLIRYVDLLDKNETLLFPASRGGHFNVGHFSTLVWNPARKNVGVLPTANGRELLFKDMRAGTSSLLVNILGASPLESAEWLGHTLTVSLANYQRADLQNFDREFIHLKADLVRLPLTERLDCLFEHFVFVFPDVAGLLGELGEH